MKTIMGVLQNTWAYRPPDVQAILDRQTRLQQRNLRTRLLFGSYTGRRLKAAFGDLMCRIVWTNVCSEIGGTSGSFPPVDPHHLQREFDEIKPDIALAFGNHAKDAVWVIAPATAHMISGPHPASRALDVPARLARMCEELREELNV